MMPALILIKHAPPDIKPGVPAANWQLSTEGKTRCAWLSTSLTPYQPQRVVSSTEPKARQTAALIATHLKLPAETAPNLHEHDRRNVPFLPAEHFTQSVLEFFAFPEVRCFGGESAASAQQRFCDGVEAVLAERRVPTALVAHGTVITLFVAKYNDVAPFELWSRLGLPSYVVLNQGTYAWDGVVHDYPG